MKRIILIFGTIAGLLVSAFMVWSISTCYQSDNFEGNVFLGYASMILAFAFIFVGVKNYRDSISDGTLSFKKAFLIGLYITLVASTIYVVIWLVDYYFFIPDFMDRYTDYVLKEAGTSGATATELAKQKADMETYKSMYQNPLFVILFTYAEILPVGLIVSLISALILKRKTVPVG
ncbi:DUF4199 domain-containing protein [Arundinibacter roseus]|uniref:DUF4199 domain-containing protein n=1 Tax=Arundinibacter roseus TaxID=2070510 RepID=A0A4R4K3S9_9BACT|nr:DUF4199 domain-containing protein [Arundinibacter roseus]TDB61136.1 DUF4199 domain-containing protein [Arundinibacter roseus]